jgi:hypothetical protein
MLQPLLKSLMKIGVTLCLFGILTAFILAGYLINSPFVFSKDLKNPIGFLQNFFRTQNPDKPCIELMVPKGFIGETEQAARLSLAMNKLRINHYITYYQGGEGKAADLKIQKMVHRLIKPDFSFFLSMVHYPKREFKIPQYAWNTTLGPESPAICLQNFKGLNGFVNGHSSDVWLQQFLKRNEINAPIEHFVPSACATHFKPIEPKALFYCGAGWDSERGIELKPLFKKLQQQHFVVYGPKNAWQDFGKSYQGSIPLDGISIIHKIREAGIALCLHGKMHHINEIPSGRVFEAAAAGVVIISDRHPYIVKNFGDSVLYIDQNDNIDQMYHQIKAHLQWIAKHPTLAKKLAEDANFIFNARFTVEQNLQKLIHLHKLTLDKSRLKA